MHLGVIGVSNYTDVQNSKQKEEIMRKRYFLAVVVGIMALALLLPACAAPAPEVITVKYSAWTIPAGGVGVPAGWTMDEIEELTNGRVQFERYWSGSLIPAKEEVEGIGSGIADIAAVFQSFQGRLSLMDVGALPGVGAVLDTQGKNLVELTKMQCFKDQFDQYNLILWAMQGGDPAGVFMREPVKTIDDLKGKKIRVGGDAAKVMETLGAVPVGLASAECYEALERGTVDGICMSPMGGVNWKLEEVGKYFTHLDIYPNVFYFIMNKDFWTTLPDDIKQVFTEVASREPDIYLKHYNAEYKVIYEETFPNAGVERIELLAADKAKIQAAAEPVWEVFVEKREKEGLPGREVLNRWLEINGIK